MVAKIHLFFQIPTNDDDFFYNLDKIKIKCHTITSDKIRLLCMMKRIVSTIVISLVLAMPTMAQTRKVQNKPYIDLRPFHFGVIVGAHLQDLEFQNVGPQMITMEDGTSAEKLVVLDQDRWDPGFTVGVLGEFRLSTHFQLRIAPTMYFGNRHLTFHNLTDTKENGEPIHQNQDLKTAYFSTACDLIFAAPRYNNHRPYIMAGVNPMLNLSGKDDDYIRLKRFEPFVEVGAGCDFYLPYFKLRPEIKFLYGLTNNLDTDHAKRLRDQNMLMYTNSVKESHSKMFVVSFYFE